MRRLEGQIRNGKAVVWSLSVFRRFLTLLSSQASDGEFLHYGRLVFLGGAQELLECADELFLKVDQPAGIVLGGGGHQATEVPRVLCEYVERVLFGCVGEMYGALAGDAVQDILVEA